MKEWNQGDETISQPGGLLNAQMACSSLMEIPVTESDFIIATKRSIHIPECVTYK